MPLETYLRRWSGALIFVTWLQGDPLPAADMFPPRPADATMNPPTGCGGLLALKLRFADGDEASVILDTGSATMLLDKSLAPKLGKRIDVVPAHTFNYQWMAEVYAPPKIFLGDVPLALGPKIITGDLQKVLPRCPVAIKGILGADCLRHYCLQLDFQSNVVRFLDPAKLDVSTLGKSYHLTFPTNGDWSDVPVIGHAGLLGGDGTNIIVDTGNNCDGMSSDEAIRHSAKGSYIGGPIRRFKHFLAVEGWVHAGVVLPRCEWDGNTYTNLAVVRGPEDHPEWLGLAFLARHLVTFDFPHNTLYLKQTSIGPPDRPPSPLHSPP